MLKKEFLDEVIGEVVKLLIKKSSDYGDSYFKTREEFGEISFLIRLSDKIERLKTLTKNNAMVDESKEDTIKDIIGYCLLELYYKRYKSSNQII